MMQEFVQQIHDTIKKDLQGIHTAFPAKIVSFDVETGLATVLPTMNFRKPDGTSISYPQITGVPVVLPQALGQQATIAFPLTAGDGCLVICAEQAIDLWMYGQETSTDLSFDLSNAICIPGLFAKPNGVLKTACEKNAVIVDVKGTRLAVKEKAVEIDAPEVKITGDLKVDGGITATKDVVGNGVSLSGHAYG